MNSSTATVPTGDRRTTATRIVGALLAVLLVLTPFGAAHADTTEPTAPSVGSSASVEPSAPAADPGTGGVPADAATWSVSTPDNDLGTDRPNYSYVADAGAEIVDGIVVTNYGTQPLTLAVYAADGFLTDTGTLDLLPADEQSTQLGSWVTVESPTITLQPEEVATIPFTVTIPENATPGDYAAGVVTSLITGTEGGVAVDRRLGSRMMLRVNGELAPSLTVTDLAVSKDFGFWPWQTGASAFTFTITNTGNTRLALDGTATVAGPGGLFGAESGLGLTYRTPEGPGEAINLLPGSSIRVEGDTFQQPKTVTVDGIWPAFHLNATVSVTGTVVAAVETTDEAAVVTASAETGYWQIPWSALIILLLIIGFVVWRILSRKRRKKAADDKVQDAVRAALAERGLDPAGPPATGFPGTGYPPAGQPTPGDHR